MSEPKMVTAAVVISLVAGILIILGSWGMDMILGVVSGILVLIFAVMLRLRPGESTRGLRVCCLAWGTAILVFSVVSFFGGSMGAYIGAILGIVGGALALIQSLRL